MTEHNLSVEDTPSEADIAFVQNQLHAYNIATTGYDDYRPLAIFMRDDASTIIAGLTGFTWGGALKVEYLWVREDLRGHGYGRARSHRAWLPAGHPRYSQLPGARFLSEARLRPVWSRRRLARRSPTAQLPQAPEVIGLLRKRYERFACVAACLQLVAWAAGMPRTSSASPHHGAQAASHTARVLARLRAGAGPVAPLSAHARSSSPSLAPLYAPRYADRQPHRECPS
jgi:hypothetical protein